MFEGERINTTENRAVLHTALRAPREKKILLDGHNVVEDVYKVLDAIEVFTKKVRGGEHIGATGKALKNTVVIGIGGSYQSVEFVH